LFPFGLVRLDTLVDLFIVWVGLDIWLVTLVWLLGWLLRLFVGLLLVVVVDVVGWTFVVVVCC